MKPTYHSMAVATQKHMLSENIGAAQLRARLGSEQFPRGGRPPIRAVYYCSQSESVDVMP
jgi:hypothetical protein